MDTVVLTKAEALELAAFITTYLPDISAENVPITPALRSAFEKIEAVTTND